MGQGWNLINVDRREKNITYHGKLNEFFFLNLGYLYQSLHIPCLPQEVDKWLSRGVFSIQPKPIGGLSTEVLDMIFEAVLDDTKQGSPENFLTCISLAIGCKRLFSVGKRHVLRALVSQHARAADCRIVCLGDNASKDDQAPPGMLTDAEIKELQTTKLPYEGDEPTDEDLEARRLSIFAGELYEDYGDAMRRLNKCVFALEERIRRAHRKRLNAKPEGGDCDRRAAALARDLEMLEMLARTGNYFSPVEYPPGPNVLCNLSKGECVREAGLVKLELDSGRGLASLAHAVLSRICYSPDSSINIICCDEVEELLAKGPWAGDRFRITSADDMPLLAGGKEWKDVTKDVNWMLRNLWSRVDSSDESSDAEDEDGDEDENNSEDEGEK